MTDSEYRALDAVNWSTLKNMAISPLHYRHAIDNPGEDTTRFGIGRAIHTAVLQPELLTSEYAVFDGERRAGAKWTQFQEDNAGKTLLKRAEWDLVSAIEKRVHGDPVAREWLNLGAALIERPIQWIDAVTGIACKGRPDAVSSAIIDVKSTSAIDERMWRAQATRLGYFNQLAFYRRGYQALTRHTLTCAFLAVELDAPHDVGIFVVDEDSMRVADEKVSRLLVRLAECRKSGKWPGRYQAAQVMSLPVWERGEENFDLEAA